MKVDFNSLKKSYNIYAKEYEKKALEVLRSGWYVLGKEVKAFEEEFGRAVGSQYCIGVDNGLNAIALGIRALDIGAGDEIIVQSNTYIATVMGITMNHANPVFVEPNLFYNIDDEKIEAKITSKTRAILVTHLYGQATKMDKIQALCKKYKLFLLEDCAQSHMASYKGEKTGTFGRMGFFSFYPTKNLGAFGDAGAIITNDIELAQRLRTLRNYGSNVKYHFEEVGQNARLDELQAGLLRVKLRHIENIMEQRNFIVEQYLNRISNKAIELPQLDKECSHVWHLFVIRVKNRQCFMEYMKSKGIQTDIHYPIPPHLSEAYKHLGYKQGDFPIAEEYANTVVSLPLYCGMIQEEIDWVIASINDYKEGK